MDDNTGVERLTLNVREAAKALGVSPGTVRNEINAGRLPAVRVSIGRVVIPKWAISRLLNQKEDDINGQ